MARRKIIAIEASLCNGCGQCVTGCVEGALQIVDGKAQLVRESYCDGLGDCVGTCPTGALTIIERESDAFDIDATREHVRQTLGDQGVERMDEANRRHQAGPTRLGCPGAAVRSVPGSDKHSVPVSEDGLPPSVIGSELRQWPVQLHLVPPGAPFLAGKELVLLSTCAPIASADTHWRFIRGRAVVVACPKLDLTEGYVEKLAQIIRQAATPRLLVVRMEVPCCGGLTRIAADAAEKSGIPVEVQEIIVGIGGEVA